MNHVIEKGAECLRQVLWLTILLLLLGGCRPAPLPAEETLPSTAPPERTITTGMPSPLATEELPRECPHTPLGGFHDVWRDGQVWPRLGCALESATAISGTEARLCCNVHSLWLAQSGLFALLEDSGSGWSFVTDGSGLPAEAVFVTPTWPTATRPARVPTPTPVPTPPPPRPVASASEGSSPAAIVTVAPSPVAAPLPTVVLMERSPLSPSAASGPCFPASGRHGWLANQPPWAERCEGQLSSDERAFSGALQRFEGGWLLWNGHVCFVLFAEGTWILF